MCSTSASDCRSLSRISPLFIDQSGRRLLTRPHLSVRTRLLMAPKRTAGPTARTPEGSKPASLREWTCFARSQLSLQLFPGPIVDELERTRPAKVPHRTTVSFLAGGDYMKWICLVGFVAGAVALTPAPSASAMPAAKPGALAASQSSTIEVKGGHGHGGGHGWGHRGGRGHHYGWGRGRGHHYGWRHHHRW